MKRNYLNGKHNIPLPTKMALGYILGGVMTWGLDPIFPTSPEQLEGFNPLLVFSEPILGKWGKIKDSKKDSALSNVYLTHSNNKLMFLLIMLKVSA